MENLYVLLMKDEVKERYERNSPPLPADIEYAEHSGPGYAGYHEVIPFMSSSLNCNLRENNQEIS